MFEGRTGFLTGNLVLDLSILAWFLAQLIKTVANLVVNRNLDLKRMVGSGDMPSSHSSFICAATASIGQIYGWQAPLFSLAAVVALVVMYDACNVRRAAGEQAKVLNYVMAHWKEMPEELKPKKKLNEHLGHTLPQGADGGSAGHGHWHHRPHDLVNREGRRCGAAQEAVRDFFWIRETKQPHMAPSWRGWGPGGPGAVRPAPAGADPGRSPDRRASVLQPGGGGAHRGHPPGVRHQPGPAGL